MKKTIIAATVLALTAITFTSCEKADYQNFAGSYTYKTSGKVELLASMFVDASQEKLDYYASLGLTPDTLWVNLMPEEGQMNIVTKDKTNGSMLITFNAILGDVSTITSSVEGNAITFTGSNTKTAYITAEDVSIGSGTVAVEGSGNKYDNVIILNMVYSGTISIAGVDMTVLDSDVKCVAKEN
ncbi:MAG: hypothetical protein LKK19_06905 [Bacteroidales bacterium]|jgi:hypothetical protein|nr:hypothetical protein [Bacteroidales bacterium]MCI2122413.1 hypothetical protein [Bacteroidales bacterium]MCI2144777.1 hypothetical protein [Bacteroidales bacterium]